MRSGHALNREGLILAGRRDKGNREAAAEHGEKRGMQPERDAGRVGQWSECSGLAAAEGWAESSPCMECWLAQACKMGSVCSAGTVARSAYGPGVPWELRPTTVEVARGGLADRPPKDPLARPAASAASSAATGLGRARAPVDAAGASGPAPPPVLPAGRIVVVGTGAGAGPELLGAGEAPWALCAAARPEACCARSPDASAMRLAAAMALMSASVPTSMLIVVRANLNRASCPTGATTGSTTLMNVPARDLRSLRKKVRASESYETSACCLDMDGSGNRMPHEPCEPTTTRARPAVAARSKKDKMYSLSPFHCSPRMWRMTWNTR
mmetsp:Transcript_11196/g.43183  ORF Transcript_11196/g.43183 Transcript_11196/m.43183 type:complete len:326 (+) Transcript_11196:177-1154(+)